jgi:hypothetical protein
MIVISVLLALYNKIYSAERMILCPTKKRVPQDTPF